MCVVRMHLNWGFSNQLDLSRTEICSSDSIIDLVTEDLGFIVGQYDRLDHVRIVVSQQPT